MAYSRLKTVDFGPLQTGLATVAYSLDGSTWFPGEATETVAGTGHYFATVEFIDGFRGVLRWRTAETDPVYAFEEINPEDNEIAASVWSNGTRTLSAFGFTVSASLTGSPTFRNQDNVTAPTYDDCLISSWAADNGKELEDDVTKTWLRYGPDGTTLIRSFVLTADSNGNPVGRE